MTRVDFYVLDSSESNQQQLFACRLAEKAYRLGHSVYIHTEDKQQANEVDQLLWSFRSNSFIPHTIVDTDFAKAHPASVEIGYGTDAGDHHAVLVNLASEIPAFFGRFERVSEVVTGQETVRASARKRYAFYRDRGYPLKSHDIKTRSPGDKAGQ
jgi:DNA polymerase-3 subunit chi